jgi:hypothetical protein
MQFGALALRGLFSAEAGTRATAPFPCTLSPLAALFLRCAPDRFLMTKPNTFQHNRGASVATLRWCPSRIDKIMRRLESGTTLDNDSATYTDRNPLGMQICG